VWLSGIYKVALYSSLGVLVYTQDNLSSAITSNSGIFFTTSNATTSWFYIDATGTPQTKDIKGLSEVYVIKTDATANTVTIIDSTPLTIPLDPLSIQGEGVHLSLAGGIWYVQ
jgi:hypothetical protein